VQADADSMSPSFDLRGLFLAKWRACLGSHWLVEFRNNSPLFRKRELGLVPDEDRPVLLLRRAPHTLIPEGRVAYEAAYSIGGPINPSTGAPFGTCTRVFAYSGVI